MNGGPEILALLRQHFTPHREEVNRLWHERDDFRDLGEAYQECTVACQYWSKAAGASSAMAREYESLLEKLREDIAFYLESKSEPLGTSDPRHSKNN